MHEFLISNKTHINSIGLLLDIVGVLCISYSFKNIRRERTPLGLMGGDIEVQKKLDKEHGCLIKLDKLGTILLIIGFLFQIISNYN